MYQHILVPVDGNTTSDRALKESLKLARQQSAQLELVHCEGYPFIGQRQLHQLR